MSKTVRRRGFTLPEVLVTITIVAVLAAVVVPAVLNQVNKGDTAGLSGDVDALRSAISNFTTDTRHYPKSIYDLVAKPLATDLDLVGSAYGAAAVSAWKGPYFPTSQDSAAIRTSGYNTTAYNLNINSTFGLPSANGNFVTLVFSNTAFPASSIATIERLFDSGSGVVPAGTSASGGQCNTTAGTTGNDSGNIQWTETFTTTCVISGIKWRVVSAAQ